MIICIEYTYVYAHSYTIKSDYYPALPYGLILAIEIGSHNESQVQCKLLPRGPGISLTQNTEGYGSVWLMGRVIAGIKHISNLCWL